MQNAIRCVHSAEPCEWKRNMTTLIQRAHRCSAIYATKKDYADPADAEKLGRFRGPCHAKVDDIIIRDGIVEELALN